MNAMNLIATLGLDTSGYESGLKGASGMAQSFASSFKKILGGVAVAGAAGATVAGAAVTKIVKSSVKAYAEYEQLVGGINKLFGNGGQSYEEYAENASDSMYKMGQRGEEVKKIQEEINKTLADGEKLAVDGIYGPKTQAALDAYAKAGGGMVKAAYENSNKAAEAVQENAWTAAQRIGMDANQYMSNVTGFSATLMKSLDGDVDKTVELSDMAMQDISDNANTYGKYTTEELAGVYQALARGNFQTLDNLSLGFNGTKEGMKDLIKAANDYRKTQGRSADLTIDKYSDMIVAIHEVQEKMKISGTTGKEAMTTIQGSLNATKAEWNNLMIAFARGEKDTVRTVMSNMVSSAKNLVTNVVPRVSMALTSISDFVGEIAPIVAQELPGLITEVGPALLQAVGSLAGSIVTNLPAMLGALGGAVKKAILGDEGENASWNEVGVAVINGITNELAGIGSKIKGLIIGDENADWGAIGSTISHGISEGLTGIGSTIKGLITGDETASWNEVGAVISHGIGEGLAGVGALIKGLITGDETASWADVGSAILGGITDGLVGLGAYIKGFITGDPTADWGDVGQAIFQGISEGLSGIGSTIKGIITGDETASWNEVGSTILKGIEDGLTGAGAIIKGIITGDETASWTDVGTAILTGIENGLSGIGSIIKDLITGDENADWGAVGSKIWDAIKNGLGSAAGRLSEWIGSASDFIGEVNWEEVGTSLWNAIKSGIGAVGDIFSALFSSEEGSENQWLKLGESIGSFVLEGLGAIGETIAGLFSAAWEDITTNETLIGIGDKIKEPFEKAIDSIKSFIDNVKTKIGEAIDKMSDFLGFDLTAPFADIAAAAESAFKAVIGWIDSAIEKIQVFLGLKNQASSGASMSYSENSNVTGDTGAGRLGADYYGEVLSDFDPDYYHEAYHASAMSRGEILHGLTPFGIDNNGTIHYGGEAGAEVVVGANSLTDMIHGAMQDALVGVLSRMDGLLAGQGMGDVKVVLDTGATVGGLVREMDKQMGGFTRWRGGGRA